MKITFGPSQVGGVVAEGFLTFDDPVMEGLKLSGIAIRVGERGLYATLPARAFGKTGQDKRGYYQYIRSTNEGDTRAEHRLKDWIVARYHEREQHGS